MEAVLGRLEGVVAADADFRTGRAVVTYDPAQTSPEQIVEAFNGQTFYRARVAAGAEAQPAGDRGPADVVYAAIGYGKYVLWGLVGFGILFLMWRVVGRRLVRVQVRITGE